MVLHEVIVALLRVISVVLVISGISVTLAISRSDDASFVSVMTATSVLLYSEDASVDLEVSDSFTICFAKLRSPQD